MMINHVVMWKLKDECGTPGSPGWNEAASRIKHALESLPGKVPSLRHLEVGINSLNPEANHDVVLVTRFDSGAGLEAYQIHPDHLAAAAVVKSLVKSRACVDWES